VKCVVALGLATVSWYAFERPILRLKARFDSRAHPEGQPPPLRAPAVADPRPTA
jgi:peptidoglycan/LPS O-acetylase OafA/YrhL